MEISVSPQHEEGVSHREREAEALEPPGMKHSKVSLKAQNGAE